MKRQIKGTQRNVERILSVAQKLKSRRIVLVEQLAHIDTSLADLSVEWADLQKEIADEIFESQPEPAPRRRSAKKAARRKLQQKRKAIKSDRKATTKSKGKKATTGTRDQIQAAAKARDEKLIKVLSKSKKPMNIIELYNAVQNGSIGQMQTSIKRLRKQLKTEGYAKNTKYSLKRKR